MADKTDKDSIVMTAFQTACLAIIVLVAKFIGDLIYVGVVDGIFSTQQFMFFMLLILVSILNFFELINNWATIKKYFKHYNGWLFLVDVVTLGVFFWQVYILSKTQDTLKNSFFSALIRQKIVRVIVVSYGIIFILYVLWNIIILLKSKSKLKKTDKEVFKHSAIVRSIQACLLLLSILFDIQNIVIYFFGALFYIGYVIFHNKTLEIFDTIIK